MILFSSESDRFPNRTFGNEHRSSKVGSFAVHPVEVAAKHQLEGGQSGEVTGIVCRALVIPTDPLDSHAPATVFLCWPPRRPVFRLALLLHQSLRWPMLLCLTSFASRLRRPVLLCNVPGRLRRPLLLCRPPPAARAPLLLCRPPPAACAPLLL